jgi:hypothetical protein
MKLTRSQFVAVVAILALIVIAALGWSGLVQGGGLVVAIVVFLAVAGVVPFSIGMILQALFRKRSIPSYVAWGLAFISVLIQWLLTRQTPLEVPDQQFIGFIGSILIIGLFVDTGIKSCRAFREGREAQLAR